MTRVAIVKVREPVDESNIREAVESAIGNLGGIDRFIKPGEKVLIKPNLVSPRPPPVTTDPRVVEAVAMIVKEAGAQPIIAESCSAMTHWWREGMNTRQVMELLGYIDMAKRVGVDIVPLDEEGFKSIKVKIPNGVVVKEIELAELALKVDKIIGVPVLKTSMEGGGLTGCLKLMHGLTNTFNDRLRWHRSDLWYKIVDELKPIMDKYVLGIFDAIKCMEGDGPIHGDPVDMNLIIAGDDPVATDAIAAKIIGYEYPHLEIGPIAIAHTQGLGVGDPSKIEVVGMDIDKVRRRFKFANCEIVEPHFPNTYVIDGASCRTCKAWIKFTLYMLKDTGFFDELKSMNKYLYFFVGLNAPLPLSVEEISKLAEKGLVIVFGECTVSTTGRELYWILTQGSLKDKVMIVHGCPPFAVSEYAAEIRRRFGLEVTEREVEAFKYVPT
ncbi:MAG: DUF362 domain-containing protein [archaeon GB-1867-005]|nr:DUF362 domain-containing protein [Candidatus Culexmicrobium cathedralense]